MLLGDGDNELPIDLDNILCIETLIDTIKTSDEALLIEMYPAPDQLCVSSPEGMFVHELVVPFTRHLEKENANNLSKGEIQSDEKVEQSDDDRKLSFIRSVMADVNPKVIKRQFEPGSEWLFLKLYLGSATADHVLCEMIAPLLQQIMMTDNVDRWFFVRYGDPDWHLRLRLHGDPTTLVSSVLPAFYAALSPWCTDGRIWKIQVDTYQREVERYGGVNGIELAEQLFHLDSEASLAIIQAFSGEANNDSRWRLCLLGMDRLLNDLGFDIKSKLSLLQQLRRDFQAEFHADGKLRGRLGDKYRQERKDLEWLLDPVLNQDHRLALGAEIIRQRSVQLESLVAQLLHAEKQGQLLTPISTIAHSYLHMQANRMLRSEHRAQEMVVYDFLARYYESLTARR